MPSNSREPSAPDAGEAPREVDILLLNADWVVTCDADMSCIQSGAVAIADGAIMAAGGTEELRACFRGRTEKDMGGHLLLPGLINTHAHAAMSLFRGFGDDLPLQQWLFDVIFPAEKAHVNPDLVYWGTLLSAAEMLQNGITTFCDGYFFEESAARAAFDSGMRAVLGQGVLDFPAPDQSDPARAMERAVAFLDAFPDDSGRIRPSLFCHSPYTCGPQTLERTKAICREWGILFQIHLSETSLEVSEIEKSHGVRPVHYLDRLGILDEVTLCGHGVWLDHGEIEILAERGAAVAHCVESNMKLASGVAPLPEMLAAGVTVGLGTDGCASNNDLDLFAEMGSAARLHKVFRKDPQVCPAQAMLQLATRKGARALCQADEIGSIEAGKRADLAAIDLKQPHLTPVYSPISHLVYSARGSDVRHVWINGELVLSDGVPTRIDMERLVKEIGRIARRIE